MPSTSRSGDVRAADAVLAAGGVVVRKGRVLLVHRPAYDDWSFPKGKLDRGESSPAAAVREVEEETGLRIRIGMPLSRQSYPTNGSRTKLVDYWIGRVVGDPDVSGYRINREIDDVAWVDVDKARQLLTYKRDRRTLAEALATGKPTRALVVLRHGDARSRKRWRGDDRLLFGFAEHQLTSYFLGTSTGLRRRFDQPQGRLEVNGKAADLSGSAWSGRHTRDFRDIDVTAVVDGL